MKTATLKQAKKLLELAEETPAEQLQKLLASGMFSDLLTANIDKVDREEFRMVCGLSAEDFKITPAPFDPKSFIGEGWQDIVGERDERSAKLTEVDFAKAKFVSCLEKGESSIKGEEKLRRLKETGNIRLGATVSMGLWQDYQSNGKNSVLERLYQAGTIKDFLDFFGTVLLGPGGYRYVLYLYRRDDGEWHWGVDWLEDGWRVRYLSAVLPQV